VHKNKILVAVDGSDQALEAVNYVALVMPPERTRVVLYNISNQFSELFSDLDHNPLYRSKIPAIKSWAADERQGIGACMKGAREILFKAGFDPDSVTVKVRTEKLGIATDIMKESYDGYHAIVVGRTGMSRLKDRLFKSAAVKLVARIKHIPVIVVGGQAFSNSFLIAFDGSRGAMKGAACVGALLGGGDNKALLFSMLSHRGHFWVKDGEYSVFENEKEPSPKTLDTISPVIDEAKQCLVETGITPESITGKVQIVESNRAARIVEVAQNCGYGSVVVGRRGVINFVEEFLIGRVSSKILKMADDLAVWIV
jgi:nucleotide-binding universal stress UspA family protein